MPHGQREGPYGPPPIQRDVSVPPYDVNPPYWGHSPSTPTASGNSPINHARHGYHVSQQGIPPHDYTHHRPYYPQSSPASQYQHRYGPSSPSSRRPTASWQALDSRERHQYYAPPPPPPPPPQQYVSRREPPPPRTDEYGRPMVPMQVDPVDHYPYPHQPPLPYQQHYEQHRQLPPPSTPPIQFRRTRESSSFVSPPSLSSKTSSKQTSISSASTAETSAASNTAASSTNPPEASPSGISKSGKKKKGDALSMLAKVSTAMADPEEEAEKAAAAEIEEKKQKNEQELQEQKQAQREERPHSHEHDDRQHGHDTEDHHHLSPPRHEDGYSQSPVAMWTPKQSDHSRDSASMASRQITPTHDNRHSYQYHNQFHHPSHSSTTMPPPHRVSGTGSGYSSYSSHSQRQPPSHHSYHSHQQQYPYHYSRMYPPQSPVRYSNAYASPPDGRGVGSSYGYQQPPMMMHRGESPPAVISERGSFEEMSYSSPSRHGPPPPLPTTTNMMIDEPKFSSSTCNSSVSTGALPGTTSMNPAPYTYVQQPRLEDKTILRKKFSWKHFPELERFLIANRDEYLRHSALNYTAEQKQYNNWLTERLLEVAARHHYVFDPEEFNFVAVRDRIRCYYKSFVQTARKRGLPPVVGANGSGTSTPQTASGNPSGIGSGSSDSADTIMEHKRLSTQRVEVE